MINLSRLPGHALRLALAFLAVTVVGSRAPAAAFLFDATKAETAGNADWVISENTHGVVSRFPSPPASGITAGTPETYWLGALSSWGVALVKLGHSVESLPSGGRITYHDNSNAQDLATYQVFVVCEPNILFTAAEKTAIVSWVRDGGSLFIISDHTGSDRNNDGADSVQIWNDLFTNNGVVADPFGLAVNQDDISLTTSDVDASASNPLTHGASGVVTQLKYSDGATFTIHPATNPGVHGVIWSTTNPSDSKVMCAYGTYGNGRFVAVGDSSPFDDGTGNAGDTLFPGWTDLSGNHSRLILNASAWLAAGGSIPVVTVSAPIPTAAELGPVSGTYQITRTGGSLTNALPVNYSVTSTGSTYGTDYSLSTGATSATIPAGAAGVTITLTPVADPATPEGNSTVTLTLLGGSGYTLGSALTAQIVIADEPFDAWRISHFGANAGNTTIAGESADPDGDGISNLLEYAFGLDPMVSSPAASLPQGSTSAGFPAIAFTVVKAALDAQYTIETSADLVTWQTGAVYSTNAAGALLRGGTGSGLTAQVSAADAGPTFTVKERATDPAARFVRLRVTRLP